jgi:hypothetical protein
MGRVGLFGNRRRRPVLGVCTNKTRPRKTLAGRQPRRFPVQEQATTRPQTKLNVRVNYAGREHPFRPQAD